MPSAQQNNTKTSENVPTLNLAKDKQPVGAATVAGNKTPQDQPEFVKQALILIEKKSRNLEKRRIKLEEYKDLQKKGQTLNEDQLLAVSKFDEVKSSLELVKELDKQLIGLANDAVKAEKKRAKKELIEREESLKEKIRETQKIQSVLNSFTDETIREDFLNGANGALKLAKEEIDLLDEFNKLITGIKLGKTNENEMNESVDHLLNLIESKNKPILNTTYIELKKLFEKLLSSAYWDIDQQQLLLEKQQELERQKQEELEQKQQILLAEQQQQENLNSQQNTSTDDFVIVSSHEIESTKLEQEQHEQQQKQALSNTQQPQTESQPLTQENLQTHSNQAQIIQTSDQRTFFSTLNAPEHLVQEFLTENNDGLNFLQDSQIQAQHQQQFSQLASNNQTNNSNSNTNNPEDYSTNVYNNQNYNQNQFPNETKENNYGFSKPRGERKDYQSGGFRNNNYESGNNQPRRSYNNDNNDRRGGGSRGGYSSGGPRGGGYQSGGYSSGGRGGGPGGNRGPGNGSGGGRGGYRGTNNTNNKPRGAGGPPGGYRNNNPQQTEGGFNDNN